MVEDKVFSPFAVAEKKHSTFQAESWLQNVDLDLTARGLETKVENIPLCCDTLGLLQQCVEAECLQNTLFE